jgi:hypothetical protein
VRHNLRWPILLRGSQFWVAPDISCPGYLTPADKLNDLGPVIFAERDRKLEEARERRRLARRPARDVAG